MKYLHELISTHAPRTGSDDDAPAMRANYADFNPRSPHGERRENVKPGYIVRIISTHAPRTGSDRRASTTARAHGAFQPTLPARGATIPGGAV